MKSFFYKRIELFAFNKNKGIEKEKEYEMSLNKPLVKLF